MSTWERIQGLMFLMPLILVIVVFIFFGVLFTVADSFFRDVTYLPEKLIGLENYAALVSDQAFRQSIKFTILFVVVSVPLEVLFGLVIALVLNESFPLRGIVRAAILIPWAIPNVVTARIFELIYNYSYGAANYVFAALHISGSPVHWLGNPVGAFFALVVADAWKTTPFAAIILLAGLSAIPAELYAQARVDRANFIQRLVKVTLPLLKPILIVTFLFRTIQALQIFDIVYVLTKGGPGGSTMSLSMYGYLSFSAGDFGYGSAISVILFLIALGFSMGYLRLAAFGEEAS